LHLSSNKRECGLNFSEISSDEEDFNFSTNRNTNHQNRLNYDITFANTPISNDKQIDVHKQTVLNSAKEEMSSVISTGMTSIHNKTVMIDNKKESGGKDEEIVLTPKGLLL